MRAIPTSIQAARHSVALAGGALKEWRGTDNLGAGSPGLGLGSTAVAELRTQCQELLWRRFWRYEPITARQRKQKQSYFGYIQLADQSDQSSIIKTSHGSKSLT